MKNLLVFLLIIFISTKIMASIKSERFSATALVGTGSFRKLGDIKMTDSKPLISFGAGVGYQISDKLRIDLTYDNIISDFSYTTPFSRYLNYNKGVKSTINSFMLNSFVNLFSYNQIKFFVGAGIGSAKNEIEATIWTSGNEEEITKVSKTSKTQFAYTINAGASYLFNERLSAEITYSWRNFGKQTIDILGLNEKFYGYHLIFGLRHSL